MYETTVARGQRLRLNVMQGRQISRRGRCRGTAETTRLEGVGGQCSHPFRWSCNSSLRPEERNTFSAAYVTVRFESRTRSSGKPYRLDTLEYVTLMTTVKFSTRKEEEISTERLLWDPSLNCMYSYFFVIFVDPACTTENLPFDRSSVSRFLCGVGVRRPFRVVCCFL